MPFEDLLALVSEGVVLVASDGVIVWANAAARSLLGALLAPGDVLDPELLASEVQEVERSDRVVRVRPLRLADPQGARAVLLTEVTVERALESTQARLLRLATHDPLTGVLNRRGLDGVLHAELERARRSGQPLLAVLVDCDDFKSVNESFGHAVGDLVLHRLATRLFQGLRRTDHVARVGGDEFLILLPNTRHAAGLAVCEKLRQGIAVAPILLPPYAVRATISLGLAAVRAGTSGISDLLLATQAGLRRSKAAGKNRVALAWGVEAELPLTSGPSSEPIDIARQPICRLADGETVAWELLVRRTGANVHGGAEALIRAAIEAQDLAGLDLRCLEASARIGATLGPDVRIFVNLFPSTLLQAGADAILARLAPLQPLHRVVIELPEPHLVGDPALVGVRLGPLRAAGLRIALDDVGLGGAPLESLIVLEPEVVKLGPAATVGVAADRGRARRLGRMLAVLRALGAEVIAESVQDPDDLIVLRDLGIVLGQGYLLGRPST